MSRKKSLLNILLLTALISLTLYFLLREVDLEQLYQKILSLNPLYVGLAFLATLLFIVCESRVVHMLLAALGEKTSSWKTVISSCIGFYFSSITPSSSGGQPMQIYYFSKKGMNLSIASLGIMMMIALYQFTLVFYAGIAMLLNLSYLGSLSTVMHALILLGFVVNLVMMAVVLLAMFSHKAIYSLLAWCVRLLGKLRIVKDPEASRVKLEHQIEVYREGATVFRKNHTVVVKAFLMTFLQQTCLYSVPYFVYRALGLETLTFINIVMLQAILNLAVSFMPLPGAVGATESGFLVFYRSVFPQELLTTAMLVSRGISYYIMLPITGAVVAYAMFTLGKKKREAS